MKKISNIALAAAVSVFAAASCQKGTLVCQTTEPATLTIAIDNVVTKATSTPTSAEMSIDAAKVYLFVFKADGSLEIGQAVTMSGGSKTTVNLTAGAKTVWVVANCPASIVTSATNLASFKTLVSELKDNVSNFVMAGSASKTVSGNDNVNVTLKRLVAKVALISIKREFADSDYAACSLVVNRVYLSNVAGSCYYYSDDAVTSAISPASVPVWYNKMGSYNLGPSDPSSLLCVNIASSLPDGSIYSGTEPVMYTCPNACIGDNTGLTWNIASYPRHTRLVVDCTLAGTQGYYSVTLPEIESNHVYNISLVINKKPSDNPEDNTPEIVPVMPFSVNISVSDWDAPITVIEEL